MKLFKKSLTIFFLFSTCCASFAWAQPFGDFSSFLNPDCARQGKRDNEFAHSGQPNGDFYCNPLMLKGVPFDYNALTLKSKGELRLTKGDTKSGRTLEIPFYLHLRRDGLLVTHMYGKGLTFSEVEISGILKFAREGDELIIEPANKEDWPAKRIVKILDGC